MKVILTKDITALGHLGTVVDVAKGYARNYLIPQGLAMEATKGNLAQVEQVKGKYAVVRAKEQEAALAKVATLEGVSVTIAQLRKKLARRGSSRGRLTARTSAPW